MITDYLTLGVRNIRKRKLRSWLTILGVLIAIATIFVLISVSIGLQDAVQEQFRQLGTDKFFVMPKSVNLGGPSGGQDSANFTTLDAQLIEKVSGVKAVSYIAAGNAEVEFSKQKRYFAVYGISEDNIQMMMESMSVKIDEGSQISKGNVKQIALGSQYKYNNVFKKPIN
ncbi:MAG: ABC transporter permease, partial [archaeon]